MSWHWEAERPGCFASYIIKCYDWRSPLILDNSVIDSASIGRIYEQRSKPLAAVTSYLLIYRREVHEHSRDLNKRISDWDSWIARTHDDSTLLDLGSQTTAPSPNTRLSKTKVPSVVPKTIHLRIGAALTDEVIKGRKMFVIRCSKLEERIY